MLENRSAGIAQVRLSPSQTAFNLVSIGDEAAAKPECIGRTSGLLLRRFPRFSCALAAQMQAAARVTAINL
jgi:hypothetical protein